MWNALSCLEPPSPLAVNGEPHPPFIEGCGKKVDEALDELKTRPISATPSSIATTMRKPTTGDRPVEHVCRNTGGDAPTAWDAFLQRRLDTAFSRGAALLPGYSVVQHEPDATSHSDPQRHVVDVELWNTYWCAFSDRFATCIDDIQEYLSVHDVGSKRRRVLVAASLALESEIEHFKESLIAHALSFGALEHVARERCIVMLQFTCPHSAEIFAAWAFSLTLRDLLGETGAHNRLLVRLVSPDDSKVTSTLEMGKNILLPTPFVESLFKGVFDAVNVIYHAGSFLICFGSVYAAKVAVHSLQRSLLEVFGLTLTFSEQHPGHVGPPHIGEKKSIENVLSL